jgi:PTS system cellobiose-specific IIC component
VIFGMPIMLNPILAIPFIITPLVTGSIGYFRDRRRLCR